MMASELALRWPRTPQAAPSDDDDAALSRERLGVERELLPTMAIDRQGYDSALAVGVSRDLFGGITEQTCFDAVSKHWELFDEPPSPADLRRIAGPAAAQHIDSINWYEPGLSHTAANMVVVIRRLAARQAARAAERRAIAALQRGLPEEARTHLEDASQLRAEAQPLLKRPTAADPLSALRHLGPIATIGRQRILDLAAAPIRYVWQDIAPSGTVVVIAGPPAEGKTTLLFLLIAARANTGAGVMLLGRLVHPAPHGQWVVLIEGEHGELSTARKLVRSVGLLGLDDSALDRIIVVARKAVQIGTPAWLDVVELIKAGLVSDICIDTVARVAPGDANDEREQAAIFASLAAAIESAPTNVEPPVCWLVAHTRKNATSGDLTDVAGSVQRVGQADSVLLVRGTKVDGRTVSSRITFAKLREDPIDAYPAPATFAIENGQVRMDTARTVPPSPAAKFEAFEATVLGVVKASPGCSRNHILKHAGIGTSNLDATLRLLVENGQLETTKGKRNTTAYRIGRADG